jgi:hypothetical protein
MSERCALKDFGVFFMFLREQICLSFFMPSSCSTLVPRTVTAELSASETYKSIKYDLARQRLRLVGFLGTAPPLLNSVCVFLCGQRAPILRHGDCVGVHLFGL